MKLESIKIDTAGFDQCMIDVSIPTLGTLAGGDGDSPILIELYEGRWRLFVWADGEQEDPTHIIDLSAAKTA